jgi:hypothetical protein
LEGFWRGDETLEESFVGFEEIFEHFGEIN